MSTIKELPLGQANLSDKAIIEVLPFLPAPIRQIVASLPQSLHSQVEEIRLRQGRPLALGLASEDMLLRIDGKPCCRLEEAYQVTATDLDRLIQLISGSSLYALEEELKSGFITLPGGHRAGITGKTVLEGGRVRTLKYFSGCNIRISREITGAANGIMPYIINKSRREVYHTLLVSPPRCGKTTLLRDIIRQVSTGVPALGLPGQTLGLVDERSEIAGCYRGIPQRNVGPRTDVLDGCPKAEGMMMLIRSMGPRVIAADEIGRGEDVAALEEVINAGVKVITTAHGSSLAELTERPSLGRLMKSKVIERFVMLGRSRGVGTVEGIIEGKSLQPVEVKRC